MKLSASYKPITNEDLDALEAEFDIVLPASYRTFLLRNNGGQPPSSKAMLRWENTSYYIQCFYAITDASAAVSLRRHITEMSSELPEGSIPIGAESDGTLLLALSNGKVHHMNRSLYFSAERLRLNDLPVIATDIDTLLSNLEGKDTPPREDVIGDIGRWADLEELDRYLAAGGDINACSEDGETIVATAAFRGNLAFIRECVARGATLKNAGVLHAAMHCMDKQLVDFLLSEGVDPNELDAWGRTPLDKAHLAASGPAVQSLVAKGGRRIKSLQ
jgi:ankyrin repeat protein